MTPGQPVVEKSHLAWEKCYGTQIDATSCVVCLSKGGISPIATLRFIGR